ncbi:MAG TPA: alpha/beta hydrolase, partial [Candidatus Omnitrophota bacterium]|nr:alpha/beta hydrolase [Candidatus Omnitrophota bacterium]
MTDSRTGWTQGQFESWDKEKIFFRIWSPPGARGTLVIIHGFGEHSGRYEKFASRMEGLPVQIAVMDLRGMGRSGGKRVSAASMEDYLKDMTAFKVCLERDFAARVPMILLGHSLGGLLAVEWASRYPESIKTLILTSPFLGLKGLPL